MLDVVRRNGIREIYSNPGSTEIPVLVDFPDDISFVLGLHESSVIGMATGRAIATGQPSIALLHTTAGLGNAVGAIATARENHAPVVILVGQQDRRHLVSEPFLTGRLEDLAGSYPVWVTTPMTPTDLPSLVARAIHKSIVHRGPAVVVVPMDDWLQECDVVEEELAAPALVHVNAGVDSTLVDAVAALVETSRSPAIIAGAGAADEGCWSAIERLSQKLRAPVWQEPFAARPGVRQTSDQFAGFLSAGRTTLRKQLNGHDLIVVLGCHALRQYGFEEGPLFPKAKVVTVVSNADQALTSTSELAIVAPLHAFLEELVVRVDARADTPEFTPHKPKAPRKSSALNPEQVFAALNARISDDTVVLEESPSSRFLLHEHIPARNPLGFVSAAMGGLGFAMPAAVGIKIGLPERPVLAIIGDGSSIYSIQALWSAQKYGVGALFIILSNGGYAIMNALAKKANGEAPWPNFPEVRLDAIARGFGCDAEVIDDLASLEDRLDCIIPDLAARTTPLVLNVNVTGIS